MNNFTLPIRFAFALTTSLIAYFLVLSLFDLHTNPFFSLFNGVITGFSAGIVTGFIASILFTIFMSVYATEIQPNFLSELVSDFATHYDVGIATFSFIVLLMGLATSVVLTLTFMQLFKNKIKE